MVIYIKRIRNDTKNHMLLAVCALLFLGLVPGILLIISETSTNETKRTVKKVKTKSTKSSKNR
jgi:NADH:ubiquinone oxidoreductase subunit 4 (subunit M)